MVVSMGKETWTAEELAELSPNARHDVVRAGFKKDLDKVSPDLLARARRKAEAHIAENEGTTATEH